MRYYIMTFTSIFGLIGTTAAAQNYDHRYAHSYGVNNHQISINSGLRLTVPFRINSNRSKEGARFGLTLTLDNRSQRRWKGRELAHSADIFELGFFENGDPNFMMMGQNLYEPHFGMPQLNAKGGENTKPEGKTKTLLYLTGGAAVLTGLTIVLANESSRNLVNCNFNAENNVTECR